MASRMKKDGVTFEELQELADQVGFTINSDEDRLKLYREARKLGWWPELDQPKMDKKTFWAPPGPDDIRYRPSGWSKHDQGPDGLTKAQMQAHRDAKEMELQKLLDKIAQLEKDPRVQQLEADGVLEGIKDINSWLDEI